MKTYGIFTAYSPDTKFEHEGLGRYLAMFLKASQSREDIQFAIACPSWSRKSLRALFDSFDIDRKSYSFVGPAQLPLALVLRSLVRRKVRGATKRGRLKRILAAGRGIASHLRSVIGALLASRNPLQMLLLGLYLLPYLLVAVLAAVLGGLVLGVTKMLQRLNRAGKRQLARMWWRLRRMRSELSKRYLAAGLYRSMLERELDTIVAMATSRSDIVAWYCPTSLWPEVHRLQGPKLICIPDMVLTEFPVPFALDGEHLRLTYRAVQRTLDQPAHFVTYSNRTKWTVAVDRFGIPPSTVSVIPHAANELSEHLKVTGFPDIARTQRNYKQVLLSLAIHKGSRNFTQSGFQIDFPYIFYASQFRPSKNIMVLLRAYKELHHNRHFGRKLILTGNLSTASDIQTFLKHSNLHNDVVFLPGLSTAQLAAAYSLADLAVNPSLSEGGMPFTFTEALSVGTPVVMADIEVTREVLTDSDVLEATVFDPYDWQALADKIEWALDNRESVYAKQRAFYDQHLASRTWTDVVNEHIQVLDQLAAGRVPA